jgi:hypothetical protein
MSRHHLRVTYWRDTAEPLGTTTYTVEGDDPQDVLDRSYSQVGPWMDAGEPLEPVDETAEGTLGL